MGTSTCGRADLYHIRQMCIDVCLWVRVALPVRALAYKGTNLPSVQDRPGKVFEHEYMTLGLVNRYPEV